MTGRYGCYLLQFSIYTFTSTDAVAFSNAHFGAGIGPIHLHVVGCTGRETNLTDCPQVRSSVYCLQGHSEDAGVRCQGLKNSIAFGNYTLQITKINILIFLDYFL